MPAFPCLGARRCGVAWRCVFTHELQCNVGVASLNATPTSKIVFLHAILMKFSLVISKDIFRDVREELYLFRPVGFVPERNASFSLKWNHVLRGVASALRGVASQ